jgi:hypothetical protein
MTKRQNTPLQHRASSVNSTTYEKMIAFIEAYDWSETSLGDISDWHPVVQNTVNLCRAGNDTNL